MGRELLDVDPASIGLRRARGAGLPVSQPSGPFLGPFYGAVVGQCLPLVGCRAVAARRPAGAVRCRPTGRMIVHFAVKVRRKEPIGILETRGSLGPCATMPGPTGLSAFGLVFDRQHVARPWSLKKPLGRFQGSGLLPSSAGLRVSIRFYILFPLDPVEFNSADTASHVFAADNEFIPYLCVWSSAEPAGQAAVGLSDGLLGAVGKQLAFGQAA